MACLLHRLFLFSLKANRNWETWASEECNSPSHHSLRFFLLVNQGTSAHERDLMLALARMAWAPLQTSKKWRRFLKVLHSDGFIAKK